MSEDEIEFEFMFQVVIRFVMLDKEGRKTQLEILSNLGICSLFRDAGDHIVYVVCQIKGLFLGGFVE